MATLLPNIWDYFRYKEQGSMVRTGRLGPLVGAIDEGTSSARFLVFSARTSEVIASHQIESSYIYPQAGWVEQDPLEILKAVHICIEKAVEELLEQEIEPKDIVAIGITNQRESTVAWDAATGKPLYNAIIWQDIRTTSTVDELLAKLPKKNKNCLKNLCGLPLSPYFSALKMRWLMENIQEIKDAIRENRCCFGTIDSWLTWNLTGGKDGGLHLTDVTNASRTMLMNIASLQWDPELCKFFNIPLKLLPEIHSSSEIYGYIASGPLKGVPISGCLGDQQSALLGQMCLKEGQAKCTYGTGCFLLYNTGTKLVESTHGLVTTVAYKMGKSSAPVYALEGSVAVAGAALSWLRDNLNLLNDVSETEILANNVKDTGDVYFVPAFSGLYAPHWQKDARGTICGISEETTQRHIIRAALEAVCFQIKDILEAMKKDCGIPLQKLQVDGGMTSNNLLMQLQADLTGISVMRPLMSETTALGAAMAAGSAEGIAVWDTTELHSSLCDEFKPSISDEERNLRYSKWKMAVERSLGWEVSDAKENI